MDKLQKVQNFTGRIDLGLRKYDHIPEGLKSLNWLPIKDRLKLNDATMVFKCIYNLAPDYLANKFRLRFCVHDRKTRSANTLIYLFAAFPLVRGILLIEKRNCGTH